jgi:transposase-like protein
MSRFAPDSSEELTDPDRKGREYLEAIRWPNGPVCPHCKNAEQSKVWKIEGNTAKSIRHGLYECGACDKQFSVMVGTIFTDSKIPLWKWLVAWYLICNAKKGVSAKQIQRALGFGSYRTAWMMMHKIRHAMSDPQFNKPLTGTVEADETYYGPNPNRDSKGNLKEKGYRKGSSKSPILALVERGGQVRTKVLATVTPKNLRDFVFDNVSRQATFNTDESHLYRPIRRAFKSHGSVVHRKKQYAKHNADGTVSHVNTAESFFSLLKRGLAGSFHHVSKEHLFRYCNEFTFRWNNRHVTDGERMIAGLGKIEGKVLTYKQSA